MQLPNSESKPQAVLPNRGVVTVFRRRTQRTQTHLVECRRRTMSLLPLQPVLRFITTTNQLEVGNHIQQNCQLESNKLAETIEYTPVPSVSPTLRFTNTVPPENAIAQPESAEDQSDEYGSCDEGSVIEESVQNKLCEAAIRKVSADEDSSEEDSSEEDSSDDSESSEGKSGREDFVDDNVGEQRRLRISSRSDTNNLVRQNQYIGGNQLLSSRLIHTTPHHPLP
jgi:DNA polymerase sigma